MAGGELVEYAWKEWGLQALVLLSFTLQVALLVLAEFRRRMDSGVLRVIVWLSYMLADAAAIYVLGHLSVTGRSPEHELAAFWASFLLLHLGGQDNITAYAIEDNRLWPRHLQTLAVQVAAAAYVVYGSSIFNGGGRSSSTLLQVATVLTFVVGVIKYGERVWALRCVGSSTSGNNYRSFDKQSSSTARPSPGRHRDTEGFLLRAHLLLDVARDFINGPLPYVAAYSGTLDLSGEEVYEVVEMQLSLMHDVLYTKTVVMHTWYGLCIHTISPLGTAAALILLVLHLSGDHRNRVDDVVVTYVLLVGAVVLEVTSAFRAAFSSWTCAALVKRSFHARGDKARKTWDSLGRGIASIRRLVHAADWRRRYWSGCMGQHNLLRLCHRSRVSRMSKMARWMGVEDLWDTLAYSGPSVKVSSTIKQLVVTRVLRSDGVLESSPNHVINSRGQAALKTRPGLYQGLASIVRDMDQSLEQSILVWHIATDIYLSWYKEQAKAVASQDHVAKAAEVLSNYMVFLLAERPYMLPAPASRNAYIEMCYGLTGLEYGPGEDLPTLLRTYGDALNTAPENRFAYTTRLKNSRSSVLYNELLRRGSQLGASRLVGMEPEAQDSPRYDMLEVIAQVWVEILCYAGYRCNSDSHAKQIGSGGELITVTALLVEYIKRRMLSELPNIIG